MKNKILFSLLFFPFFIASCNSDNNEKRENELIVLDANKNEIKIDTTLVTIADLPVKIDSVSFLIHPIGNYKIERYDREYIFKSSRSNSDNFKLTNNYGDEIKGNMNNLLFQKDQSSNLTTLTKKNIKIKSVCFLRDLFDVTKKKVFLYEIVDTDTNDDKKINLQDLYSIYISNVDGSNFRKISKGNQKILDTKFIKTNQLFYFKTLEKGSSKEMEDIFHYYYLDLSKDKTSVKEYFPIKE